jgi:ATP-dependent DNA helicase RecG
MGGDPESRFTSLEARGPMMSTIRRVLTAIVDDLPKAFSLPEGGIQRQDIPIVPFVVIREAVVNTLMHRNYRAN